MAEIAPTRKQRQLMRALMHSYDSTRTLRLHHLGHELMSPARLRLLTLRLRWQRQFLPHYYGHAPRWRVALRRLSKQRVAPDFAVISAIKSGSSDLTVSLLMHPALMPPLCKEIGLRQPDAEDWRINFPTPRQKKRWASRNRQALCGYFSPYLQVPHIAHRLAQLRPDMKIILLLRNPVDRAYSHWKWDAFLNGRAEIERQPLLQDFDAYIEKALKLYPRPPLVPHCGFDCLSTGLYDKPVRQWTKLFGAERVLPIRADAYMKERQPTLLRIQEFLGVDAAELPTPPRKINTNPLQMPPPSQVTRNKLAAFYAPHNENLWRILRNCPSGSHLGAAPWRG